MRDQYDAEFFAEFHEAFAETVDKGIALAAGLFRRLRAPRGRSGCEAPLA